MTDAPENDSRTPDTPYENSTTHLLWPDYVCAAGIDNKTAEQLIWVRSSLTGKNPFWVFIPIAIEDSNRVFRNGDILLQPASADRLYRLPVHPSKPSKQGAQQFLVMELREDKYHAGPASEYHYSQHNTSELTQAIDQHLACLPNQDWQLHTIWQRPAYTNTLDDSFAGCIAVLGSCQYPPDLLRERLSYHSLRKIHHQLESEVVPEIPRFLLLAGDTVYVDPTAGMADPTDPDEKYDEPYRQLYSSSEWKILVGQFCELFFCIDDHEIEDNFESATDENQAEKLSRAREHFLNRHFPPNVNHRHSELARLPTTPDAQPENRIPAQRPAPSPAPIPPLIPPLWSDECSLDGIPMFVMDTRTERDPRKTIDDLHHANMVQTTQLQALRNWLLLHKSLDDNRPDRAPVPKLIMSPSMILPRSLDISKSNEFATSAAIKSDSWEGYPLTTFTLLSLIAKHEIHNVIFLSGDEHLSCLAQATLTYNSHSCVQIYSIHSSPLYGPYPFANSQPQDFCAAECFTMQQPENSDELTISVDTRFYEVGNGYATLDIRPAGRAFSAAVTFIGDRDRSEPQQLPLRESTIARHT